MFCLIRATHKFDIKVSYNLNTGGDQWKVTETYVFDRASMYFSLQAVPDDKVPPPAMSWSELYPGVNINECLCVCGSRPVKFQHNRLTLLLLFIKKH